MAHADSVCVQAFDRFQTKMIEHRGAIKQVDAQLFARDMESRKSALTLANLEALPSEGRYYNTVGRMCVKHQDSLHFCCNI